MLPIIYVIAGFVTTWLVIRFGEKAPLLDLPEVSWARSFFWTLLIWIASVVINALLGSISGG